MEEFVVKTYKVFAKIVDGNIEDITGGILTDICPAGYTEIDEGSGDRYAHCQNNYLSKYREEYLDSMLYMYAYENGEVRQKTQAEIDADKTNIEAEYDSVPTVDERLVYLEESQEMQDEIIADILETM